MSTHSISLSIFRRKSPLIIPNIIIPTALGLISYGLQNEFKPAVVNEPSVFEPLKFHCIYI